MTPNSSSCNPYLTDDDSSVSEDDEDDYEVGDGKSDTDVPQIVIKCSTQRFLQETLRQKEEEIVVDQPQPLDYELVRNLMDAYTDVRAQHEVETAEDAEVNMHLLLVKLASEV